MEGFRCGYQCPEVRKVGPFNPFCVHGRGMRGLAVVSGFVQFNPLLKLIYPVIAKERFAFIEKER